MSAAISVSFDENIQDFGNFLKKKRKEKHLTQAELASLCGLSVMSIRRYEANERKPRLEEMIKLGKTLGFAMSIEANLKETIQTERKIPVDENIFERFVDLGKDHERFAALSRAFTILNSSGKEKAIEMVTMLTHIPEYTKTEDEVNG